MIGKRKRRASLEESTADARKDAPQSSYHDLLRRHFESTYEPLELDQPDEENSTAEDSALSDEWDGISDDVDVDGDSQTFEKSRVEIIDYSGMPQSDDGADGKARKAFMTSKLPSEVTLEALRKAKSVSKDEDPTSEAALVKNDLALQRLLRDSKLLASAPSRGGDASLEVSGKNRHKALDSHLRALGAKTSLQSQKNMPRDHRLGIAKKAAENEATRRSEAREAGVILEKVQRGRSNVKRRERGVGAPGVGKFRGGTLTLNAKDVRAIQGPSIRTKGRKGRR